jgi:PAS domain S-box-containing protein
MVKSEENIINEDEKLLKSSEMLSSIYNLNPDAISLTKVSNGEIIDCNQIYINQIGYTREEVIGHTLIELKILSLKQYKAYVNEIQRKKNLYDYEVKIRQKTGKIINILYSAKFTSINGEQLILSIGKDITERKKVENELKAREDKFRTFFENILDAVLLTIPDGTILAANPAAEELFGYTEEEICKIGRNGLVDKDDPNLPNLVKERILTGKTIGEITFIRKDGTKFPGEMSTSVFKDGNGDKRTSMVIRDNTKRKQADKALINSEERYRSIIENIQDAYIRANNEGNIIMASPSAAHMYKFDSPQEMIGIPAHKLYKKPEDRKNLLEKLQKHEKVEDYESEALRKDGTSFLVSLNSQFHYDEKGQIQGTETFVRDINERKKLEEKKQELLEQLQLFNEELEVSNEELQSTTEELRVANEELQQQEYELLNINQALRESEVHLRRFYESGLLGVIYWNIEGKIMDANDKFLNMIGYTREDLKTGRIDWAKMTPPEYQYLDERSLIELKNTGVNKIPFEKEYIRKDGSHIPVIVAGAMLDKARENGVAFVLDITERKIAENSRQKLLEKEKKLTTELSTLIENIVDEVWFCDSNGTIILANAAARKFEQKIDNELIKSLDDLIAGVEVYDGEENLRPKEGSPLLRALKGEVLTDLEEIVVFPRICEKEYRQVSVAPIINDDNEITGAVSVVRDITIHKRAESELKEYREHLEELVDARTAELEVAYESLKEKENQYLTLFNSIDEGFCTIEVIFDADDKPIDYRFLEINPAFEGQTGLVEAEGKLMRDLAPDHEDHWFEIYGKIALTGKPMRFVNEAKALNRWYDVYAFKIGDPEGREVAILFNDITKRKKAEDQLKEYQDTLEEKVEKRTEELLKSNKELEQFAYVSSHDLQEPIRMVTSFTQLLERHYKGQLDADADEYINFIVEGAHRMKYLIDDLLAFSRLNTQAREFENVKFETVLNNVLSNLSVSIKENNASINHDPLPTVMADESQMMQVFQNLIVNAIKFHGPNQPEINISAQKVKNEWIFAISDNGIGIDPEYQKQIFEVFKRLHTRKEYPGSGIGLSISQKIINRQGGRIWVESELGEGSTFYFTIPIN